MTRRHLTGTDTPTAKVIEFPPRPRSYFVSEKPNIEFIQSGCTLLDCVIGGGWPLGRIANIIGDKAVGKTLLAMEGAANFLRKHATGKVFYREAEAAFDPDYARALGIPIDDIDRGEQDFFTVEDIFEDLDKQLDICIKGNIPALYILDSLDALSDRAEQKREIDEGSYGTGKARKMSELFRRLVQKIEQSRMCFIIISQVRENIGVTFGRKTTRSGGKAIDFYASQIIYLAHIETLYKTINKIKRAIGVRIKAKCDKNKISLPYRECEFDILFGHGVDDVTSTLDWLREIEREDILPEGISAKTYLRRVLELEDSEYRDACADLAQRVTDLWREIDEQFLPDKKKYE